MAKRAPAKRRQMENRGKDQRPSGMGPRSAREETGPIARRIALGASAAKPGLAGLPAGTPEAQVARITADVAGTPPERIAPWRKGGGGRQPDDSWDAAIAIFPERPSDEILAGLARRGFSWNRILGRWEGVVRYAEAATFVTGFGGSISKVRFDKRP